MFYVTKVMPLKCLSNLMKWYYCYLPAAVIIQKDLICILGSWMIRQETIIKRMILKTALSLFFVTIYCVDQAL